MKRSMVGETMPIATASARDKVAGRVASPATDIARDREGMTPSALLHLQRVAGNRSVVALLGMRSATAAVARAWGDADTGSYPAPKQAGQPPAPPGGWNAGDQTVSGVERIPIEGLTLGLQAGTTRSTQEKADDKAAPTREADSGKAIAVVPATLKPAPIEILLHLHGHNIGYRERSKEGDGMAAGTVRDVVADRVEQQVAAGGRNLIAILPQGTQESGFGAFDPDPYIAEVWAKLVAMKKLPTDARRGAVVLAGHSGAASPIGRMLAGGNLPTGLGELILFDAIHGGQRPPVETFLQGRMAADVKALRDIADPAKNNGLDAGAVAAQQAAYLAGGFRFRGIFTPKFHPQKRDADNKPMWQDPETKKKPVYDESIWQGYGVEYEPLRDFIKGWIDGHTKGLDATLVTALRQNYQVLPAGAGATHNTILGANDNLQTALGALPVAKATTPAPKVSPSRDRVPVRRRTMARALVRRDTPTPATPASSTPAPLTDVQQWEKDWNADPGHQHLFAGEGRPAGTPRERYDVLCPLYRAQGIPRPMVYVASSITTGTFYQFSSPMHAGVAAALKTAEGTLKGKGHATAPIAKLWGFNPRTTSTGKWSNHADGKAVDLDDTDNPHLDDQRDRKIISLVTGTDMEKGSQGWGAMKDASDRFKADYDAAGMTRRITELGAAEEQRSLERNLAKSSQGVLDGQRDQLKTERATLKQQRAALPRGRKATPADVANAAELDAALERNRTSSDSLAVEIKARAIEVKKKESALKDATTDRKTLEQQLTRYEATDKAVTDLQLAVTALPDEIKALDEQVARSKADEQDAATAKDAAGVKAQQKLRATLTKAAAQKRTEQTRKAKSLDQKKASRDAEPLRGYAAGGFLNLSKDVVDAMVAAGLKWGGDWKGAKDFMHFDL